MKWYFAVLAVAFAFPLPAVAQDEIAESHALHLSGEYDDAIGVYRRLVRRAPQSAAAARGLARVLLEVGRHDDAARVAERFSAGANGSAELQNLLGEAWLARGRWDEAATAFTRAVGGGASDSLTARLNLAVLEYRRGNIEEAMQAFDRFIDVYSTVRRRLTSDELVSVATAVKYLGARNSDLFYDAKRAYELALEADPQNLLADVLLGELFLEKYNGTDARSSFDAVLRKNPNYPLALLGKARAVRFAGEPGAVELVERSLEVNENLVPSRVFLATLLLQAGDKDAAEKEVAKALEVDPRSLDALSVLAAIRYLNGDEAGFEKARSQVFALNPRHAEFYNALADASVRHRLYREAAAFARRAIEIDSMSWRAYQILGINQLRSGVMDSGRINLEWAFEHDPFDVWTKNTLDLLDTIDEYRDTVTDHFRILFDPGEADLLAIYFTEVAEDAFTELAQRYASRPPTPIRVEVFSTHADFSVRTVGLTGLGALGVSFGPVVAMDAPAARLRSGTPQEVSRFNWASTLWHEIAHSFHMELSGHRVPRWLTEGLAVYEERRARPGWGNGVTPEFLLAYRIDGLWPVGELENGFVRPRYPEQLIFSYYQASLVCEILERDHGRDVFRRMLLAYGKGWDNEQVFRDVLGVSAVAVDRVFDEYMEQRFGRALAGLDGYQDFPAAVPPMEELSQRARRNQGDLIAQLAMGRRLVEGGRHREALPYLERARELLPGYAGHGSPYWYLAVARQELGDSDGAIEDLEALAERNAGDYRALVELAGLYDELSNRKGTLEALDRAMYVDPYDPTMHERLATLASELRNWPLAIRERRASLALRPVDEADALYALALAYFSGGETENARRTVIRALENAPNFAQAQELLLEIHSVRPR